jgi:hypothetical protein
MLIETWIAALMIIFIFIISAVSSLGWLVNNIKNEELNEQLLKAQKENAELKHYIAVQKTKSIIGVANDFYNEGKKK